MWARLNKSYLGVVRLTYTNLCLLTQSHTIPECFGGHLSAWDLILCAFLKKVWTFLIFLWAGENYLKVREILQITSLPISGNDHTAWGSLYHDEIKILNTHDLEI